MLILGPIVERIKVLLSEDTDASVTYAALEARLALEKVCYDRLRQRHDYISQAQLSKWQPGAVVNTLLVEVDPYIDETMTLYISSEPADESIRPEDHEYVEIGTEIGLDSKRISAMWNALANLALHVPLPKHKTDVIPEYGDRKRIRAKVEQVVVELERLGKGTMSSSGTPFGGDITFDCSCGETNRRRASLLRDGQFVHCFNPKCKNSWKAIKQSDGFWFEPIEVGWNCDKCNAPIRRNRGCFIELKLDEVREVHCDQCKHMNYVQLGLIHVRPSN